MIALVLAAIAYCRAFFIGRHRLGLEVAALRQQLAVLKRKRPRASPIPRLQCLTPGLPQRTANYPFKILALRGMVVILYEVDTIYRQIFTDGRELPKDPNPTWTGYSVGRWEGDTLVVDTAGFNDDGFVLPGRLHSDALHIIERFRRRDFGHLEIQFTIDDPNVYATPWSFRVGYHLSPDTELLEFICNENEKDLKHMGGIDR